MKLSVLEKIDQYMVRNRQVGHTTVMLEGVNDHPEAIVVVGNLNMAHYLRLKPGSFITVQQIAGDNYWDNWSKGKRSPIVIDNAAFYEIAKEAREVLAKRYLKQED